MNLSNISERLSREWFVGLDLTYEGVDFGLCMVYDTLQICNRILLSHASSSADNQ